ncbi:MAG: hypothetical protein DWP97_08015, partial [Calditrichaeota bacterium]
SLGNVSFSLTEEIDPIGIDSSNLSIADVNYVKSEVLGLISVNSPTLNPVNVSLNSIAGLASSLPGDSAAITPMMFTVFNNFPTITEFSSVTVANGVVNITVTNGLGIDLDTVIIQLFDRQSSTIISNDTIVSAFTAGSQVVHPINLNGRTVSNLLRIDVAGHTNGGVVDSFSTRYLATEASFGSPFEVSSAVAQVPSFSDVDLSDNIGIDVDAGEQIDSASLSSGTLSLIITNFTALNATLDISLPGLRNSGVPYTITQPITAGQTVNLNNALSGYTIVPQGDSLPFNVTMSIPGSGSSLIPVNMNDSFAVDASISNLNFASVSGILPSTEVTVNTPNQTLDIPDGFNNISFVSALLTLTVENGVDLPGNLICTLYADNGNQLEVTGLIDARGTELSKISTITNADVADFLNPLPELISINGTISFGDSSPHTITATDSVFASVSIYAPLHVKVDNATINDLDIEREEIEQNDIDKITDHFKEGRFIYTVQSHLPLGVTAIITMGPDSAALYTNPALVLDTFYASPAPVDPLTGITNSVYETIGEIYIDSTDIEILKNEILFIRPILILNSSDTAGVLLTGNDYFTIQGRVEVDYTIDGDF